MDDSQPIGIQSRLSNASPVRIQDQIHNHSRCNSNYPMLRPSGFRTRFTTNRDPIPAIQCFARPDSGPDSQPIGIQSRLSNASPTGSGSDSQPFAIQSRLSNASPVRIQDLIHNHSRSNLGYPMLRPQRLEVQDQIHNQSGSNPGYPMLRPQRLEVQDLIHNHSGCNLGYPMLRPRVQDLIHNHSRCNPGYPMLRPSGFRI